jgi:Ca-activated chloride channel family protein
MRPAKIAAVAGLTLLTVACASSSGSDDATVARAELPPPPAPPPPPPPPPPAPPPVSVLSDEEAAIAVTGTRIASPGYAATSPIVSADAALLEQSSSTEIEANLNKLPQYTPQQSRYAYVPPIQAATDPGNERYDGEQVSAVHVTTSEPVSTFSVDVDTGAYANVRRFLSLGNLPPRDAVRTEELVNYFRYDYRAPDDRDVPFSVTTDVSRTPWNPDTRLLRIGLRGYDLPRSGRPPANLVFLIDVSGSMDSPDKLPLVKAALAKLAGELQRQDRVSIVVYAGAAGLVLQPTNDPRRIRAALDSLSAGGSTAGGAGLQLAYNIARDNMIEGGVNRVILATDGDFNVGVSNTQALIEMIERERNSGITLTALGFGTGNYNEAMMEQVADHGNGNYAYIDSALEADKVLSDEMASTLFTIAKDVKIQVEFNPAQVSQYRLIGYENRALREEDFANDRVDAGDIGAGHQVTAIYEIVPAGSQGWISPRRYGDALPAEATGSNELAFVKLRYKLPNGDTSRLIERAVPASLFADATNPRGDMAFAVAVAAYGQKLRGDPLLAGYGFQQIAALAGPQDDFWRQEFLRLASLAGGLNES